MALPSELTPDTLITVSLLGSLIIYCIFSAILQYHWNTYSIDARINKLTLTSYYVLTLILLAIMGAMAFII